MMTCSIPAVAAPLVVLLGTAMALAASPEGAVAARDRSGRRLTRGGCSLRPMAATARRTRPMSPKVVRRRPSRGGVTLAAAGSAPAAI
jgi:hypothetical protein